VTVNSQLHVAPL